MDKKITTYHFYLRIEGQKDWIEVSKKKYLEAERRCGFFSKFEGEPASLSFGNGLIEGRWETNETNPLHT